MPPNQAKSVQTCPCFSDGRVIRLDSRWPLLVHISNTCRLLSSLPPLVEGMPSSTKIAIFDPDGDGMRALIFVGSSIGGATKGGRPSGCCEVMGIL